MLKSSQGRPLTNKLWSHKIELDVFKHFPNLMPLLDQYQLKVVKYHHLSETFTFP